MYTAWEKVRISNQKRYNIDSPLQPESYIRENEYVSNLEKECLEFIREDCEGLRFDETLAACEDEQGNSIGKNQIPFNMQKDTERLCIERAVHKFMKTGTAEDAFDIYFCYLELFIGRYGQSKKIIEMLAEFEMNASSLLMKHRDHYSHSAYVFVLGLAIFHNNEQFRKQYRLVHMKGREATSNEVANHFLQYWGLTSLFHDIGYPFELPFEQVKSYFNNSIKDVPFVSYKGLEKYVVLSEEETEHFSKIYETSYKFKSSSDIIAYDIERRLGEQYHCKLDYLRDDVINKKPVEPDTFGGFMDHAVFSGIVLYKQLVDVLGYDKLDETYVNCLSAITLHNSMFKFSIRNGTPLPMSIHPLAYMLMLCDELQCWDRISYGQNSRRELHPMWFDATFEKNKIYATYFYNRKFESRKDVCEGTYRKMVSDKFINDIAEIVDLNTHTEEAVDLELNTKFIDVNSFRKINTYLSESNYIHLYNFAVLVHGRKKKLQNSEITFDKLEQNFDELSLEYKLSVIERTKNYAKYLDAVGFFYTDRSVIYDLADEDEIDDSIEEIMGALEHTRWYDEKIAMGWKHGILNQRVGTDEKKLREVTRIHKDIIPEYEKLDSQETKEKDKEPLREMIRVLSDSDGIRIYKMPNYEELKQLRKYKAKA